MQDSWKPMKQELREWAYDPNAIWPDQDFDLSVAKLHFDDLIIDFSADDKCPKRNLFLKCAYLIVGDAVMTDYKSRPKTGADQFLVKVKAA